MIELGSDPVFPLAEVPAYLQRLRAGRKVHISTPQRWARHGVAGVKLRVISLGGTVCTSAGALQEFFDGVTAAKNREPAARAEVTDAPPRKPREDVQRRLEEIGF